MELAQDLDQWQILVLVILNFQVLSPVLFISHGQTKFEIRKKCRPTYFV
jgi:hypothetical protein